MEQATPLIVGAGPTGLAAALFLAESGVHCRVVDKAPSPSVNSRAQVINPRSLELLQQTGVTDAILREAHRIHRVVFYEKWTQLAEIEIGHAHPEFPMAVLPQARSETLLSDALATRGIVPERGTALGSFTQDNDGVDVVLIASDQAETFRTPMLLGADGAHSKVRETLGIPLEGSDFPETWPLHDIELDGPLDAESAHVCFVDDGLVFLLCIGPGIWRVFGNVPDLLGRLPPGTSTGKVQWESSFHIADRVAKRESDGRVVLAGDAAHIHAPVAARGMNLGIEDAFVFAHCALDALNGNPKRLSDYNALRHDVHKHVVDRIDKLTRLARGQPGIVGMFRHFAFPAIARFGPTRRAMIELLTGLDHPIKVDMSPDGGQMDRAK
jgi:2-polyprenyl-6-methoxyphenol hydroxylase-like FAD-dependent oxidoreductase